MNGYSITIKEYKNDKIQGKEIPLLITELENMSDKDLGEFIRYGIERLLAKIK